MKYSGQPGSPQYIYGYPWHLPDLQGTVSRPITWMAEGFLSPRGGGVWVDDMYMGTALLTSYSLVSGRVEHLLQAGHQLLSTAGYLSDGRLLQHGTAGYLSDGRLLQHGYSHYTGHLSCCRWGRGNGWAVLATTEYLLAATQLGVLTEMVSHSVMALFRQLMEELLSVQSESGLWHNILDNNQTMLETSSSAMFLTGLIRAQRHGWLESPGLSERIERAWQGVASRSQSVKGKVCLIKYSESSQMVPLLVLPGVLVYRTLRLATLPAPQTSPTPAPGWGPSSSLWLR